MQTAHGRAGPAGCRRRRRNITRALQGKIHWTTKKILCMFPSVPGAAPFFGKKGLPER
jgi:hypothetical protein